jgi:hypothetical protein
MNPLLPRLRLVRRITSEAIGVVFLRAPAGAGKSVLLGMVSQHLGRRLCSSRQPRMEDVEDGCLIWDVPSTARSARLSTQILDAAKYLLIACRPEQRISGMARRIMHEGAITFAAADMVFAEDELSALPAEQQRRLLDGYAGWPAFLPITAQRDDAACIDYLREVFLASFSPSQTATGKPFYRPLSPMLPNGMPTCCTSFPSPPVNGLLPTSRKAPSSRWPPHWSGRDGLLPQWTCCSTMGMRSMRHRYSSGRRVGS